LKSKPLWKFWYHLSIKRTIENIERDKLQKEVALAKADILEASLELKDSSSQHHQFLKSARYNLETGAIEPLEIIKLVVLARQGKGAVELSSALLELSSTDNLSA